MTLSKGKDRRFTINKHVERGSGNRRVGLARRYVSPIAYCR